MRLILGLGGNVGDVPSAFRGALEGLGEVHAIRALSALYRSAPVGPPQPRFWNMAVVLELRTPLGALLDLCQELEEAAGRDREREVRWGPRPLDLDLLLGEGVVCRGPRLELPHPRLLERAFALVPAAEVAPDWRVPGQPAPLRTLAGALGGEVQQAAARIVLGSG